MASLPGCCARLLKVVGTSGSKIIQRFQKSHLEKPAMSANTVYILYNMTEIDDLVPVNKINCYIYFSKYYIYLFIFVKNTFKKFSACGGQVYIP